MIDISLYRARIGIFTTGYAKNNPPWPRKQQMEQLLQYMSKNRKTFENILWIVIFVLGLACYQVHQYGIGKNIKASSVNFTNDSSCEISMFTSTRHLLMLTLMYRIIRNVIRVHSGLNSFCLIVNGTRRRTCSYLIGNAGLHAYNGNPLTER